MTELRYLDQDPGDAPYLTRILVTDQFMRLDDGNDDGDFVLLERKTGIVINVLHGQQMQMRIRYKALPVAARSAKNVQHKTQVVNAGTVRAQIFAGGEMCSETVSARDLLPDVARALAQYKSVLAYTQWQTWLGMPPELQHVCDLVIHASHANSALKYGLPLEERDYSGRTRQLQEHGKKPYQPPLFKLPAGYMVMQPPEVSSVKTK